MTKGDAKVQDGHLLWLDCGLEEIKHRKSRKHKNWPDSEIQLLLDNINSVYQNLPSSQISTHGRTAIEVARELSWIVFVGEYKPAKIGIEMNSYGTDK